jgi:hypothetical protein
MPRPPGPHRRPTTPADFGPGAAGVDRLRLALERAEREFVAQVVADGGIGPWRRRVEGRFRSARDALARSGVSRAESAALVVALVDHAVRDRCWRQVDADPDGGWLLLWRHLARRALPPYRTEPLFLLAWTAWRRGDLATARTALGRTRVQDPAHRASALLGRLLSAGIDPRVLPSLAADRPAPAHRAVR